MPKPSPQLSLNEHIPGPASRKLYQALDRLMSTNRRRCDFVGTRSFVSREDAELHVLAGFTFATDCRLRTAEVSLPLDSLDTADHGAARIEGAVALLQHEIDSFADEIQAPDR